MATPDARAQICGTFSREPGCTPIVTAALSKWLPSGSESGPALVGDKPLPDGEQSVRSFLCKHG